MMNISPIVNSVKCTFFAQVYIYNIHGLEVALLDCVRYFNNRKKNTGITVIDFKTYIYRVESNSCEILSIAFLCNTYNNIYIYIYIFF